MTRTISFWPAAIEDMQQAYDWYELQQAGLGGEFVAAINSTLDQVVIAPERFAKVNRRAREAIVKQFPFALYFIPTSSSIDVISVFHASRDPHEWRKRLRK